MHAGAASTSRVWKGKARQQPVPREGPGGNGGVVLPLQLLSGSPYESVYTLSVLVGPSRQNLSLQVDTGSADLWIASKSCSSSSCSQTGGHLYDPSSSTSTGQTFDMTYAEGQVIGPIVWDTVDVGGYTITNQALGEFLHPPPSRVRHVITVPDWHLSPPSWPCVCTALHRPRHIVYDRRGI